ncbi:MAG: hypothetical protein KKC79_12865, partial [Gammaproteobacteria bacterium]|nr:hypothetical protein [Gammaproteobacteria bacterium]
PPEIDRLEATMDIRAYRERPHVASSHKGGPPRGKRMVEALWAHLLATRSDAPATGGAEFDSGSGTKAA